MLLGYNPVDRKEKEESDENQNETWRKERDA